MLLHTSNHTLAGHCGSKARSRPHLDVNMHRRRVSTQATRRGLMLTSLGAPCGCGLCSNSSGNRIPWYDSYFAYNMAHGMSEYEQAIRPVKERLFGQLLGQGTVSQLLEVGVGTGPNLPYYRQLGSSAAQPQGLKVTGLDPNISMQQYAELSAQQAGLQDFAFVQGSAEQMPFDDGSFDAAVLTLVLCSIPDVPRALQEVARVVRPGGQVVLVEHVIAPEQGLLRLQQQALDGLQQLLADGCHLSRDTEAALRSCQQLRAVEVQRLQVPGAGLISPHVAAVMIRA